MSKQTDKLAENVAKMLAVREAMQKLGKKEKEKQPQAEKGKKEA